MTRIFIIILSLTCILCGGSAIADKAVNHKGEKTTKFKIKNTVTQTSANCDYSGETSFTVKFSKEKQLADYKFFVITVTSNSYQYDVARIPLQENLKEYPVAFMAGECATDLFVTMV